MKSVIKRRSVLFCHLAKRKPTPIIEKTGKAVLDGEIGGGTKIKIDKATIGTKIKNKTD